jgi:hypothetical protein
VEPFRDPSVNIYKSGSYCKVLSADLKVEIKVKVKKGSRSSPE